MQKVNLGGTGLKATHWSRVRSVLWLSLLAPPNLGDVILDEANVNNMGMHTSSLVESHDILDKFCAAGGNFIDTADAYGMGDSETCIGLWLEKHPAAFRKSVVIATKIFFPMSDDVNDRGLSRVHIMEGIEASLKRMKTNYVDLIQCHCFDLKVPLEETFGALADLVHQGKVHYVGISNFCGWQLQKAIDICKGLGIPIVSAQMQYNLIVRSIEWEFTELCRREHVAVMAWSPMAGGWLSGKFKSSDIKQGVKAPEGSRIAWADALHFKGMDMEVAKDPKTVPMLETLEKLADDHKCKVSEISLAWLIAKGVIPIIGVRNADQLECNLNARLVKLTTAEVHSLDAITEVPLPYPYAFIKQMNA